MIITMRFDLVDDDGDTLAAALAAAAHHVLDHGYAEGRQEAVHDLRGDPVLFTVGEAPEAPAVFVRARRRVS